MGKKCLDCAKCQQIKGWRVAKCDTPSGEQDMLIINEVPILSASIGGDSNEG